jgi:DNA-binding NarL/FixJ family response regulator
VTHRPRVVVVDDHAGFRATARRLLEADGFEVIGEAADGPEGVAAARALRPDLLLVDVGLPTCDGFAVAVDVTGGPAGDLRPHVVLISSREPGAYAERVRTSPALGLIAKDELTGPRLRSLLARAGAGAEGNA